MNAEKKTLIYKALAVTLSIMLFSLVMSQVIYERKMGNLEGKMATIHNNIKEINLLLSLSKNYEDMASKKVSLEGILAPMTDTVFETGIYIEKMAEGEKHAVAFEKIRRQWVLLATELWLEISRGNKTSKKKRNSILYFYPPKCGECITYRTVLTRLHEKYKSNLWIISIPVDSRDAITEVMKRYYDVDSLPAVIVNGTQVDHEESLDRIERLLFKEKK